MSIKIIKAEGGLASQMLQVALYLELLTRGDEVYFDLSNYTKDYDCHNGWEVEKVFFNLRLNILKNKNSNYFFRVNKFIIRILRYIEKIVTGNEKLPYYDKVRSRFWKKYNLKFFYNNYGKNIKIDEVYSNVGSKYDKEWYKKDRNIYYTETYSSEKYFENAKELIQQKFIFSEITEEKNLELMNKIRNRESVSIHVRRGDYVGNNIIGNMVKLDYYNKAIEYIENKIENPIYVIFSNDIEWCKENLSLVNKEVIYVEWNKGEKSFRDMQLMSLCKHNICTNSGFSWWGAWLNKNLEKIVIIPEKWYSSESKIPSDDIAPQNWIKIKNY